MTKQQLSLLLLLSLHHVSRCKDAQKEVPELAVQIDTKSASKKTEQQEVTPVAHAFGDLVDSLMNKMDEVTKQMDELYHNVAKEGKALSHVIDNKFNLRTPHTIINEETEVKIRCSLPESVVVEDTDLEIINDKVLRLKIEDNGYTITVDGTLDNLTHSRRDDLKALTVTVQTEKVAPKKEEQEKDVPARCCVERATLTQTIVGTPLLNEIKAEFDKETHTLTLLIPKKVKDEKKQLVRVSVK